MRLEDEVTFAMGNISGQQLCLSKLVSRQPLCQGPEEKQTWSQATGWTVEATQIRLRRIQPGFLCLIFHIILLYIYYFSVIEQILKKTNKLQNIIKCKCNTFLQ